MFYQLLCLLYLLCVLINGSLCVGNKSNKEKTKECSLKDQCEPEIKNKYSKEANTKYLHFLNAIEDATRKFKSCNKKGCSCYFPVISKDLEFFKEGGISEKMMDNVKSKGTIYQIIDHKLYRSKDCMFPARCAGVEHFLLKLLPDLPNMDLVINTRDWPQIHKGYGPMGPVFSFSKTHKYGDIMYPAWAFWEGGPAISLYPTGIGRWDKHRIKLGHLGNTTKWETKISKVFFRGSRTSSERDALVLLSRDNPELVDAQYTKNQAWKSDEDTLYASPAKEVSFEDHCNYKYLFNFRGVAASFRFKHILLCKSLVFHVGDEWQEFFYPALKPWIHYVPVDSNASKIDLQNLIEFFVKNDDAAQEIAKNGYEFVWNHLRLKDVFCYWKKLLKEYASLLKYKPRLDKSLKEIKA